VLTRRLYVQIYLTIIASLVLMVVLGGVLWDLTEAERSDRDLLGNAERLASLLLPPADAPLAAQRRMIDRLGRELDVDISLFDHGGDLIAAYGTVKPLRARHIGESGWHRSRAGPILSLDLSDGRWLMISPQGMEPYRPLKGLPVLLGLVAICVGLAAFPLVRRLTRRLEDLQRGVERIGAGDLGARVPVRGRDEIARLAESFNEAADKIEKLVGAHRLLLANASHELRTPLSRIRLGLEMAEGKQTERRRAALKQDIAELDALIDEILLMSRLDVADRVDDHHLVDLVALAAEECARFDDCTVSGRAPEIRGDPRLLHRLLRNLLENASKHGAPPIVVHIEVDDGVVTMTVSDGGQGIPEADRDKVFQPFYRGADRQNVNGYGLGLPLVRQIAEAHGGSVSLAPATEHRSAVTVSLPLPGGG